MEKTTSILSIISSAIREWRTNKNNIKDEEIIGADISDDRFKQIMESVGRLSKEEEELLIKTRNGVGAEKLGDIEPKHKKQMSVEEPKQEIEKVQKTQQIEKDGFER